MSLELKTSTVLWPEGWNCPRAWCGRTGSCGTVCQTAAGGTVCCWGDWDFDDSVGFLPTCWVWRSSMDDCFIVVLCFSPLSVMPYSWGRCSCHSRHYYQLWIVGNCVEYPGAHVQPSQSVEEDPLSCCLCNGGPYWCELWGTWSCWLSPL